MDAVDEVKSRLNIEDVIGEYVELKRAGRNWRGLSPFGNEKTPSFMVSPEKQIWHDFSSGKGGNMFSFVMEMEGLDFKGALELLARKAGVELEQYRSKDAASRGKEKERLYAVLDLATKFYQVQFSKNQTALEYIFKKRAFTKETALEWRLGYSPNTGRALLDFLKAKGYKEAEITKAGLTARAYRGGLQDMFRGRIMIPLQDATGRVIGFTARLLADAPNAPKYINTPQTALYDKSRHVYGLHLAKEAIRKSKFVVLVEGNLDVIASHQAGVRQVVATAGTAMTEQHLKALSRFTGDIRLSFDADNAGINATERAIPIASKVGVSLSIITIPSGKDPDELIKQSGVETWEKIVQEPQYALDWLIERYKKVLDINTAVGKREFSDIILAVVRRLQDPVEREHYIEKVAEVLRVSREALLSKLEQTETAARSAPRKTPPAPVAPTVNEKHLAEIRKTGERLLALALMQPKLRSYLEPITADMLVDDPAKDLLAFLKANPDFVGVTAEATASQGTLGSAAVLQQSTEGGSYVPREAVAEAIADDFAEQVQTLRPLADYVKILNLEYEELYQDLELTELQYEAARKQAQLVDQYVKMQKPFLDTALMAVIDKPDDDSEKQALRKKIEYLNTLRNTYKRGV
ncbi:MAG TPA: DNA primase [Candidatus Saccharimonadales bacterium]|nr:DNA primase [Candidatus Saccharimonadales bacterium]